RPPVFHLLQVARPFDMVSTEDRGRDGLPIAVRLEDGTMVVQGTRGVCETDGFEKEPSAPTVLWDFHRAGAYVFDECDQANVDDTRMRERVAAEAAAASVDAVARRLWFDEPNVGTGWASPSLMTAAVDLTSGGPVSLRDGLAVLIDAYW